MNTKKLNLVLLTTQEQTGIEGGSFIGYCYSAYRNIRNWASVL
jgi:hypothetical protein